MLSCLKTLPPPSTTSYYSSPGPQGDSVENTPRSSAQPSQTIDLTREYTLAVQTSSYGEIRRTFDQDSSFDQTVDSGDLDGIEGGQLLEQVLQPSRECVQETLSIIRPSPLTDLVATYFEHSEQTSRLCFLLYQKVRQARLAYAPIHDLLDDLPLEFDSDSYSLPDSQCNLAYNVFLQFDCLENPFLSHASQNFDDMRQRFSQLTHELDHHPVKPRSRVHLPHFRSAGSAFCLIAAAVGVAITAVAIATHALVALAGSPLCFALFPYNMIKKERGNLVQLDEASRSAYVLLRDLDTIDRLVAHLLADVENDKFSIHHALERDMDKYLIQEILKQLRRNRPSFMERLAYLEDNLFLCFAAINRTRSRILQKLHQLPD
ncbi:UPF0496 protein At3g19330-like [Salvia miltiorrhiza]|uniref:UPF0496 protein At3g19330-like n=1 Tax=Salvia miltiorrhiza TaxID=226208 RepID=UPI0025ABB595|nr:UPF0496 protein At3g19330-like [Salvia miltiorrhiza]XP_057784774.1 UPF0496 protein At3g19330-like [Salvia miltiorrhiza]